MDRNEKSKYVEQGIMVVNGQSNNVSFKWYDMKPKPSLFLGLLFPQNRVSHLKAKLLGFKVVENTRI